jgi:hypothetical protein
MSPNSGSNLAVREQNRRLVCKSGQSPAIDCDRKVSSNKQARRSSRWSHPVVALALRQACIKEQQRYYPTVYMQFMTHSLWGDISSTHSKRRRLLDYITEEPLLL